MQEKPFVIQLKLETPIVLSDYLTLDALLAARIFQETKDYHRAHNEIPLSFNHSVYHGSIGFLENYPAARYVAQSSGWIKGLNLVRGDISEQHKMPQNKGDRKYEKKRGPFKNISSRYFRIEADAVRFAGCGDLEKVRELTEGIFGIGKKRNQGYGTVRDIQVKELDTDISLLDSNGMPMRPLPLDHPESAGVCEGVPVDRTGKVPPNYEERNKALCYVPSSMFWGYNLPCSQAYGKAGVTSVIVRDSLEYLSQLGRIFHEKYDPMSSPNMSRRETCDVCGTHSNTIYSTNKYALCEKCYPWSRYYAVQKSNGVRGRNTLGTRDAVLVAQDGYTAYTSFYPNDYFQVRQIKSSNERLADLAMNPPEPPWIYMEGGNDVKDMLNGLATNHGKDFYTISGPNKRTIRAYQIRDAINAYMQNNVPLKDIRNHIFNLSVLENLRMEDTEGLNRFKKRINKAKQNYPDIDKVVGSFPLQGSEEFRITIHFLKQKEGANV